MTTLTGRQLSVRPWDGNWYLLLAEHGYADTNVLEPQVHFTPYPAQAFFPGFPWLVRVAAVPLGGQYAAAAVVVTALAGVVFALGVRRLTVLVVGSERAGLVAVALAATAPLAVVYSLAYAEVVVGALTAWALVGVLRRQWLLTAACTFLAGLTRPSALALIVVVVVAAGVRAWREGDRRAALCVVLAPLGWIGYLVWVAGVTGSPRGYSDIQQARWSLRLDGGLATAQWAWRVLSTPQPIWSAVVLAILVGAVAALVVTAPRLAVPVWSYAVLVVALTVGTSGIMFVKARGLLVAFVLVVPLAGWLVRQRPATAIPIGVLLAVGGIWVSAYSLSVWRYGI